MDEAHDPSSESPASGHRIRGRVRRSVTPQPPAPGAEATPHVWRPARFLVVTAHPDDAEFGPAATAAGWIQAGSIGRLVCCTSGDQGGEDPALDPLALAATREAEQSAAAAIVGYDEVVFLHQPDGALANELPLREMLVREIRRFRPDAILTHDPEVLFYRGAGVNHADHRAAGMAVVDAAFPAARNPMAFPALARAGLAAHAVRRLYLFWPNEPTVWVDVGPTLDRKLKALRCHASQIGEPDALLDRVRRWAVDEGESIGARAAEAFRLIVIDDDQDEGPGSSAAAGGGAPAS
jgi:LmbE family N-acetylglucosaminyl deacetylase